MASGASDVAQRHVPHRSLWGSSWSKGRWGFWTGAFLVCFVSFVLFHPQLQEKFVGRMENLHFRLLDVGLHRLLVHVRHVWVLVGTWPSPADASKYSLLWMAPFLSGGGYSSEAISYTEALVETKMGTELRIMQHGDSLNYAFFRGLPASTKETLITLFARDMDIGGSVVICHSEPGAWYPPLFETAPCPPTGYKEPLYVIGRTMFETDRVTPEHVERCNRMDEIWVPTEFHVKTFMESGVQASKLVKIPQIVDVAFFDPAHVRSDGMPMGKCIFGSCQAPVDFVFLSIFKWEMRKGWDILLKAYMTEFGAQDRVALYLLTNPFHFDGDLGADIEEFVESAVGDGQPPNTTTRPTLILLDKHVPQTMLPGVYKAADAFVLPSRGEGWGRPHVEAMAMALPVIATNWSGMTEYMTEDNSYLIPVARMVEVREGPFRGHGWAEPCVDRLQELMRHVMSNRGEARGKGLAARDTMVAKYSPRIVADQIVSNLGRVQAKLDGSTW